MGLGKYLYCIIRCSEECSFKEAAPIGDAPGIVHTIPYNSLSAVVSESAVTEYDSTRANMLAHERVQEMVMREFTILPVRFGTVAQSESAIENIRRLLQRRHQEFDQLLSDMEGKIELGLKALWRDEKAILEEVLAQNESLRKLRDSLIGKPPQASHYDRIHLGEMVKEALDRKRDSEAITILAPLRQLARNSVENKVIVDRMIINAAFLVDRDREAEFDQAVRKLDENLGHRVTFKYIGAVPPYNFVNITVNWQDL